MPSELAEDPQSEQLRKLSDHLEGIEKAIEAAYVLAGDVRDRLFDSTTSDEEIGEVVVDRVFGRLGACGDLVTMARGELAQQWGKHVAD